MRHHRRRRAPYSPSPCASIGELHADMRAVVTTAIEITRRNSIGTRLTSLQGALPEQAADHDHAITPASPSRRRAHDLAERRAARSPRIGARKLFLAGKVWSGVDSRPSTKTVPKVAPPTSPAPTDPATSPQP